MGEQEKQQPQEPQVERDTKTETREETHVVETPQPDTAPAGSDDGND